MWGRYLDALTVSSSLVTGREAEDRGTDGNGWMSMRVGARGCSLLIDFIFLGKIGSQVII